MQVAGVDGCDSGWLVVRAEAGERLQIEDVRVAATFADVLRLTTECAAVGVDIPIGLSEDSYWRSADLAARAILGRGASSVFAAPARPVLNATTQKDASIISKQLFERGVSAQAFAIYDKVREADGLMTPGLQDRIFEVHPEVCLWAMNGETIAYSKKHAAGSMRRLELIRGSADFSIEQIEVQKRFGLDDFLDGCAAAWTAARHARGESASLPPDPPIDARGLRMEIVY